MANERLAGTAVITYLKEVDEVTQHYPIHFRKLLHNGHCRIGIFIITNALLVELLWDKWLFQLSIPKLQEGC